MSSHRNYHLATKLQLPSLCVGLEPQKMWGNAITFHLFHYPVNHLKPKAGGSASWLCLGRLVYKAHKISPGKENGFIKPQLSIKHWKLLQLTGATWVPILSSAQDPVALLIMQAVVLCSEKSPSFSRSQRWTNKSGCHQIPSKQHQVCHTNIYTYSHDSPLRILSIFFALSKYLGKN